MGSSILTFVLTPFERPFTQYPGVLIALAVLSLVVGYGLGGAAAAYRRRVLEKRLGDAKEQARRSDAEGRRFAELLGVTASSKVPLTRLSNDQLRKKAQAFVSALHAQLAAWRKEIEGRLGAGPPAEVAASTQEKRQEAWNSEARRLLGEHAARLAAYQDRFKVDAVILRTEISRRLERPPERSTEVVTRIASPVNLSAMAEVAGELEALAKLLPDDSAAQAQAAERKRRARGKGARRRA